MLTRLESAQVDEIVSIYTDAWLYYKLNNLFHKSFHCKSIVKQLSGSKLERLIASKARVECEYMTRLECDVTLELYRIIRMRAYVHITTSW